MIIKINCYDATGIQKNPISYLKNIDTLEFNEIINGGQGGFNIDLNIRHDDFTYSKGDFIEYIIFSEVYKNGIHKYTGVIKGIERYVSKNRGQGITLQIEGLVSLLSDYSISKTYSGTLNSVITTFINDFHTQKNITSNMEYLGGQIFKNGVSSSEVINTTVNGDFLSALKSIFGNRDFFIDKSGSILLVSEITKENVFTFGSDMTDFSINSDGKIEINLSDFDFDISVGEKILLQNIDTNLNLEGKRINELAFSINNIKINAGKIINYVN